MLKFIFPMICKSYTFQHFLWEICTSINLKQIGFFEKSSHSQEFSTVWNVFSIDNLTVIVAPIDYEIQAVTLFWVISVFISFIHLIIWK